MGSQLLATKLHIPPPIKPLVHRERLVELLERSVPDYRLTLVSAPAGYGKTTLLADWARASSVNVGWLSLSDEENDPEGFFRHLLTTWEDVQPGIIESPLGLLLGGMMPDIEAVLSAFINVADNAPDHVAFVLDDYHLITEPEVHTALTFLLDHLPPKLHFLLATREEPPLPLARYRARNQLFELRANELGFLLDETACFLNEKMDLDLSQEEIVHLQTQLEGWIAGLQLVSLSLRRRPDAADKLVISGRHRFIADYLSEDVLAQLPAGVQRFLLQTSILDRLSGSLCDAVTERQDSQQMLDMLERENLFILPLDDNRAWFRYHLLFADFLQEELKRRFPDEVIPLHRRVARWCLDHDLREQAFRHAIAGNDLEQMIRIFERYSQPMILGGELRELGKWLETLPPEWFSAYPVFAIPRAGFLAFSGSMEGCFRCLNEIEQLLVPDKSERARRQLAMIIAVRCFIACMQNDLVQAEVLADEALRTLPGEDLHYRPGIYGALGDTYRKNGRWDDAKACYLKVLDFPHSPGFRIESVHVYGALADLDLRQGHLRNAADYWDKALALIHDEENWGTFPLPLTGWVYLRRGELDYECNDLTQAQDHLARGLERAELGGDARALIAGYLLASRINLAAGDIEAALDKLEQARPHADQAQFPDWTSHFERAQVDLWLAQEKLSRAVDWADAMLQADALAGRPESEPAQLALARVLIVKGDAASLARARSLLQRLLGDAEFEGRTGVQIEGSALQALAAWKRGERPEAMTSLEHALRLAEPEGYIRLFVDLGLSMASLLQEARARHVMPGYVQKLLAAFGDDLAFPAIVRGPLPEPLSVREREILRYIAAGLTNREIADTLVISPETVKKHTASIYGKLGVGNRTEAAVRSRELNVLD
jgi:LuxR family transcriptional regulator, maltose regulon positive regulatory protein